MDGGCADAVREGRRRGERRACARACYCIDEWEKRKYICRVGGRVEGSGGRISGGREGREGRAEI